MVTGRARFIADVNFPHQLCMRVVRSTHAHGIIRSVDATSALAMPGVVEVWTTADVSDVPPIYPRSGQFKNLWPYCQSILAKDRVRYIGDPVAVVFAEDAGLAEDAAERVVIDFEELPPLVSATAQPAEFAPGRTTEAAVVQQGYGDVEAAFRDAHTIVELELTTGRHASVPMETRGAIGRYEADRDILELHGAAKVPHRNREQLADMLGRAPSSVHLHEYHVGGGFGGRGEIYPEDVLVMVATLRLGRPVKWIEDRLEHMMCSNQSRQQHHIIRAAANSEGRLLAIDDEFFTDQGAYIRTHETRVSDLTCALLPGPYRVPAYNIVGHVRLTNKTPAATYRSPWI